LAVTLTVVALTVVTEIAPVASVGKRVLLGGGSGGGRSTEDGTIGRRSSSSQNREIFGGGGILTVFVVGGGGGGGCTISRGNDGCSHGQNEVCVEKSHGSSSGSLFFALDGRRRRMDYLQQTAARQTRCGKKKNNFFCVS
jgi:hypothetical protein